MTDQPNILTAAQEGLRLAEKHALLPHALKPLQDFQQHAHAHYADICRALIQLQAENAELKRQLEEADEQFCAVASAHYQTRQELLRMNTRQFHHKDGIAERLDDGSVALTQNGTRIVIDADSWTSLVAAVSKNGGNSETYQAVQALHTGPALAQTGEEKP